MASMPPQPPESGANRPPSTPPSMPPPPPPPGGTYVPTYASPPPSGGRSWGKIIGIGCGALLLLSLLGGIVVFALYKIGEKESGGGDVDTENTVLYRNSSQTFGGTRGENFVDFSFRYPDHWEVIEDASSNSPNFIKVENRTDENVTLENLAVGYIAGDVENDAVLDALLDQLETQFRSSFPGYTRVGDYERRIGGREGRGFAFSGMFPENEIDYWGKVLLVPIGGNRGIAVVMMATEQADDLSGPDDLGEEGELPILLDSFEIHGAGSSAASTVETTVSVPPVGGTGAQTYNGRLEAGDLVATDNSFYDTYQFSANAGERVVITLRSADFDAYLQVYSPSQMQTRDDDSGGGHDSRVELNVAEPGTWTVWANSLSAGETGAYTLTIERP